MLLNISIEIETSVWLKASMQMVTSMWCTMSIQIGLVFDQKISM